MIKDFTWCVSIPQLGAALSHLVLWTTVAIWTSPVLGQSPVSSEIVTEKDITITLPVFIISLISTIGSTWTIAILHIKRSSEVQELKKEVKRLSAIINKMDNI